MIMVGWRTQGSTDNTGLLIHVDLRILYTQQCMLCCAQYSTGSDASNCISGFAFPFSLERVT